MRAFTRVYSQYIAKRARLLRKAKCEDVFAKSGCRCGCAKPIGGNANGIIIRISAFISCLFRLQNGETSIGLCRSRHSPHLFLFPRHHDRFDHKYDIGFLTRPLNRPPASVYNYVWYCNMGAARFGWWAVFILRAEMLLLYHSSSADIPEMESTF